MEDYLNLLEEAKHVSKFTGFTIEVPDSTVTDPETGEPRWEIVIDGKAKRLPMRYDTCMWYLRGILDANCDPYLPLRDQTKPENTITGAVIQSGDMKITANGIEMTKNERRYWPWATENHPEHPEKEN
jgi:hypothetical protein